MSGDCGHGWAYHSGGAGSPCDRCTEEARERLARRVRIEEQTVAAIVAWLRAMPSEYEHGDPVKGIVDDLERGAWKAAPPKKPRGRT